MIDLAAANVFDWAGPDFLKFYALFAATVLVLQYLVGRVPRGEARAPDLSDPYLIACLRGGERETLRVATVALVDRGLLRVDGDRIAAAPGIDERASRVAVERALLRHFSTPRKTGSLVLATEAKAACEEYARRLVDTGTWTSRESRARRELACWVASALLVVVAAVKLVVALSRGRTNVGFLFGLALIATLLSVSIGRHAGVDRSRQWLRGLRTMLTELPARAKGLAPGGATAELSLLAAVFGLEFVPLSLFPPRDALFGAELAEEAKRRRREVDRLNREGESGWFFRCSSGSSCSAGSFSSGCSGGCGGGCGGCSS